MKNTTNFIIISILLLVLVGGIFIYFNFQKNVNQEKQQECARTSVSYIENENKRVYQPDWYLVFNNSSYYKGFCFILFTERHIKQDPFNKDTNVIMNLDKKDILIYTETGVFDKDFYDKKKEIFSN